MPDLVDDVLTKDFTVGLDATSGVISITVAWPVNKGQCLDGSDNDYCSYTLRSRL
jgi:type IV pilus assembly protein PilV